MVGDEYYTTLIRLLLAMLAGGLIGLERTFHGRPAGFRTHTLVCGASALLMLLTVYQWELIAGAPLETVRVDPTRMAQGIMTGIGFLGAGVIVKERLAVRGLTTAASIWMTASIGIIIGMGLYFAALVAVLLTFGILSVFRWIENVMPTLRYGRLTVRFSRTDFPPERELRRIVNEHGLRGADLSYQVTGGGELFEYQLTIRTRNRENFRRLAETLNRMEAVREFSLMSAGN